jgi:EPS-associated MarR family transcriptional regulator
MLKFMRSGDEHMKSSNQDLPVDSGLSYQLLRVIDSQGGGNQRELARRVGVSVGKVNYCLRALVDRGWVKVNNFRRSDNKWAYAYLLTPSGVSAKAKLAKAFLGRKEREFAQLQSEIADLRQEVTMGSAKE